MKLTETQKQNFLTLQCAGGNDALCILDAREKVTGRSVALVCAAQREDNGGMTFVPLAVMIDGNPYEMYDPPNPNGGYL